MSTREPSTRITVRGGEPQALAHVASHLLGLTEAEARRFAAAKERTAALFRPSRDDLEVWAARLRRHGAEVTLRPAPRDGQPCARHGKLAELEVCPQCRERRACDVCLSYARERACPPCQRRIRRRRRFRAARVAALLALLGVVALSEWLGARRVTGWSRPIRVAVFPVPTAAETAAFASALTPADLAPIEAFLAAEAQRYEAPALPQLTFVFAADRVRPPPAVPEAPGILNAVRFSLALRWWAWTAVSAADVPDHDVRIALVLHPPRPGDTLPHSAGLARGRIGVVHAFASADLLGVLRVVTAHELLHIAGARDKYAPTGVPAYPAGYVDPSGGPGPRPVAEIMAGTRIDSEGELRLPETLSEVAIGAETAREIGWVASELEMKSP